MSAGGELIASGIEVRPLTTMRELDACVALQVAVWGFADGDVIPRRVFIVANHIGGQVFGALVEGALAGFAMALPGFRDGEAYLHSHMLAVLPQHRNAGLGRRLKLAQRTDALERGFRRMEWTFDPLEVKNAYFNLHRLGATCSRYEANFYGSSSSPLQGGLPTDRLCARWDLASAHVARALEGAGDAGPVMERVRVLADLARWRQAEATGERAQAAQTSIREQLQDAFDRGLQATGYEVDVKGDGAYLLSP